jgi:hypothetical protein
MSLFQHVPHPYIRHRITQGPAKVTDQLDQSTPAARFNSSVAVAVTRGVGSMWCAYVFAAIALFGLPTALAGGVATTVSWVAQTFLQLVLLSVIIVGQNVQAAAADKRALDTYNDAEAILHEAVQLQLHLVEQDKVLVEALGRIGGRSSRPLTWG